MEIDAQDSTLTAIQATSNAQIALQNEEAAKTIVDKAEASLSIDGNMNIDQAKNVRARDVMPFCAYCFDVLQRRASPEKANSSAFM